MVLFGGILINKHFCLVFIEYRSALDFCRVSTQDIYHTAWALVHRQHVGSKKMKQLAINWTVGTNVNGRQNVNLWEEVSVTE